MAEILSLPTAAPAAPAIAGGPALLDGASAPLTIAAPDPFAAFLATAQAMPAAAARPAPIALAALPTPSVSEDGAPTAKDEATPGDDATVALGDETMPMAIVDPTLSPALAMLSALATTQAAAPPAPAGAPPQLEIVAKTPTRAPFAPSAAMPAKATPAATPDAESLAAAPAMPIVQAAMIAATVTTPSADTPVIARPEATEPPAPAQPAAPPSVSPPSPPPPAIELAVPLAMPTAVVERAVADTTPQIAGRTGAVAEPSPSPEADDVVASEATPIIEQQPAPPARTRPIEPRAHRDAQIAAPAAPARGEAPRPVPPVLRDAADTAPDATRAAPIAAAPVVQPPESAVPSATGPSAPAADPLVQRQLIIADDGRWLDSLARDIARSAGGETMQFRLEPVNLGSLTVAIAQGSDGTAIRMTAETHHARDLLVEAQPALIAEARANGLKISETQVDLGASRRDGGGGNHAAAGGQQSFTNGSAGQQAMRQDGNARRQPEPTTPLPERPRPAVAKADAPTRDRGARFA